MLDCVEVGPADADASVLWLHGLGADGHDFEEVVPMLGLPGSLRVRFVFPHAPAMPVTLNGGMRMRAWYDLVNLDLDDRGHDEAGIRRSAHEVRRLLERERGRGVDADKVVLAGFSQGGAVALYEGLRHPEPLGGILGLSCYLLLADRLGEECSDENRDTPVWLGHGTQDPVVPLAAGEHAHELLRAHGQPVSMHRYPVQHGVHPQEIADIGAWLRERLA